jgi:hypothetical protein
MYERIHHEEGRWLDLTLKRGGRGGRRAAAEALAALQTARQRYEQSDKGKQRKRDYVERNREEINKYNRDRRKRLRREAKKIASENAAAPEVRF